MVNLNVSELNVVIAVCGAYTLLFGVFSERIKEAWLLGEARMFPLPLVN